MVPNLTFRQVYRSGRMAKELHNMSPESLLILHQVYSTLLRMLKSFRQYTDIAVHGASKLHIYFTLLNYFAYSRTEKLMVSKFILIIQKML
jgi:ubiquitin carboxyl-terminal hydrolase 34